ncbi:MAG TPA: VCBS repeat-containing protein, partial [Candidatus Acidoferrum sp.]
MQRIKTCSRRRFLQGVPVLAGGLAHALHQPLLTGIPAMPYLFEEIPPSQSGIHWRHVAGMSPEKHLPETSGAGCAFLDFDGDGWMDIYLVNSGKCDFYDPKPPLRNALYRNNRDGTFTDVTEKARV